MITSLIDNPKGVRVRRWLGILIVLCFLSSLPGCDVILPIVYFESQNKKKSNNSSSTTPPPPDVSYSVYVANFASPTTAATEKGVLDSDANGGNPSLATWTLLGQGSATSVWTAIPASMNAVLVQCPLTQVYNIDTFERLDLNGAVVEVPTLANIYFNRNVTNPGNASGMLDGVTATTVITDPAHIPCVFALFTQSVSSVRVRLWGPSQASGDCVWSNHHELANTDTFVVGGAAASSSGTIYTTYADTTLGQSFVLPFSAAGTKQSAINLTLTSSTAGGVSVAVDSGENLFAASELASGQLQIQKYALGSSPVQWTFLYSGVAAGGANSVRPHGLSVASNVPLLASPGVQGTAVLLAGGQGTSGSHTIARFDDTPNSGTFLASQVWGPLTVADPSSNSTTWSGGIASGSTDVLTTGNLSNISSGNIEIFTQDRSMTTGSVSWPTPTTTTGGGAATNNGNAIGVDAQGFAYVAGNFGSASNGKDSVLLRYKVSDGSGLTTLYQNGVSSGSFTFSGANEFLDVAVDTDGTTYAVGYVTQSNLVSTTASGAVTSWWIGKFSPTGLVPLWTATFNFGVGNDRAITVSLSGNFVYVVGAETFTGPKTGTRVLKFVK